MNAGEDPKDCDDDKIPGFSDLHFNYLNLPIEDSSTPTYQQAERFLEFVANPLNQPVHVHCRWGMGRTGVMIALYRYSIQGWPMDKAISETRLFGPGIDEAQEVWLARWAHEHKPGEHKFFSP